MLGLWVIKVKAFFFCLCVVIYTSSKQMSLGKKRNGGAAAVTLKKKKILFGGGGCILNPIWCFVLLTVSIHTYFCFPFENAKPALVNLSFFLIPFCLRKPLVLWNVTLEEAVSHGILHIL